MARVIIHYFSFKIHKLFEHNIKSVFLCHKTSFWFDLQNVEHVALADVLILVPARPRYSKRAPHNLHLLSSQGICQENNSRANTVRDT